MGESRISAKEHIPPPEESVDSDASQNASDVKLVGSPVPKRIKFSELRNRLSNKITNSLLLISMEGENLKISTLKWQLTTGKNRRTKGYFLN